MHKGITLKDIARKLNMSISTVSKALNKDKTISALTRERVQAMADKVNYIPNETARNFKLNKTYTIGLVIPDLLDQFYVLAINGVEKIANHEKYNVIIAQTHEDVFTEEKILKVLLRNRVDGVIAVITRNTINMSLFKHLENMGIPVVFIAREPAETGYNSVVTKNLQGSFDATEHLILKGHSRIAHLMGPPSINTSIVRLQGHKDALIKHGLPFDINLVKEVDFSPASTENAMDHLLNLKKPPTAINVFKTYIALDAIKFLKEYHPALINTIDFVGFGNFPLLHYLDQKPIASIEENSYHMGEEAATLLFKLIQMQETAPLSPQQIQIDCRLIVH